MADTFVAFCREKAGSSEPRAQALDEHLKHLKLAMNRISLAAALKNEDGRPSGSIMIVSAVNAEDARRFVESDPFFDAGVWESVQVHRLGAAVGNWVSSEPIKSS